MSLHPGLSRRDFCKGLGFLGAAFLLGGCERFHRPAFQDASGDRKSTRLNSSHIQKSRMPSSA